MEDSLLLRRRDVLARGTAGIATAAALTSLPKLPSAAAAPQQVATLNTVGLTSNGVVVIDELLKQQGYFEEFGLKTVSISVSDGSKALAALIGGGSDVCMQAGFGGVLPAIGAGAPLKVIAGAAVRPQVAIYSANPDIQTVRDLQGRTVGTGAPGTLLHALVVAVMKKKNVDYKTVRFVNVGSNTDVFRAVAAGKIDAGPGDVAFYSNPGKYGAHSLHDGALWIELPEYINQASFTTETKIREKREAIVRILAAYAKVYRFLQGAKSRDAYVRAFTKVSGNTDEHEAETQWKFYQEYRPFAENLVISEAAVRSMQELNIALGVQKTILSYGDITDMSLARDALKLLG